ncbi:MAG TPA: MBL fold metallo-hydrolase [Burkholderiales bacterium]|nr:MBL fold metallo-hydrolase [Burkholderiales bacterium]
MKLTFLGATGTVTGSKYLLTIGTKNILVDCGLFQGYKQLRLRNWARLPVDPRKIDAVVLTHAHIDHSGYLPLLIKNGFSGPVYSTRATRDLCGILLPDSGHLQEEEAEFANRHGFSKHSPALPLYTREDGKRALRAFTPAAFGRDVRLDSQLTLRFSPSGHILGSAFVQIRDASTSILFSGDIGRPHELIMPAPAEMAGADYLVLESTYGDRRHESTDPQEIMASIIQRTVRRKGVVVIPAFAVGRAQTLLYCIHLLKARGAIPDIPVYLNSPMATDVTRIYHKYRSEHRLTPEQCEAMCSTAHIINSVEESIELNEKPGPMIIISASGMATGGRVVHHLKKFAPDPRNTILFSGFQAGGTRGDGLINGAETIKIHGEYVPVRAEVASIHNLSAHADYQEILDWLSHFKKPPRETYITHGEPGASDALRRRIEETKRWRCTVPEYRQTVKLA